MASVSSIRAALQNYNVELTNDMVEHNRDSAGSLAYQIHAKSAVANKNIISRHRENKALEGKNFADLAKHIELGAA